MTIFAFRLTPIRGRDEISEWGVGHRSGVASAAKATESLHVDRFARSRPKSVNMDATKHSFVASLCRLPLLRQRQSAQTRTRCVEEYGTPHSRIRDV